MYGSMRKKFLDDLLYDEVVGKIPTFLLFSSTSPNFRTSSLSPRILFFNTFLKIKKREFESLFRKKLIISN